LIITHHPYSRIHEDNSKCTSKVLIYSTVRFTTSLCRHV